MMNKSAFSLVELLVTLAIIGIVAAVIMNSYNGIQNSALAVAQQKDQAELNQVMAQLHMSGANIAAILNGSSNPIVQALALTQLAQGNVTSNSQTEKGTIGNLLSANKMIVPYGLYVGYGSLPGSIKDDGRPRIIFSATGAPSIVMPVVTPVNAAQLPGAPVNPPIPGFEVVTVGSTDANTFYAVTGPVNLPPYRAFAYTANNLVNGTSTTTTSVVNGSPVTTTTTTPGAVQANLTGSKYAAANSYVWNEDANSVSGPPKSAPANLAPVPSIQFTYAYGNGLGGSFNAADYIGQDGFGGESLSIPGSSAISGNVYIFAYLTSGTNIKNASDITMTATLGTGSTATNPAALSAALVTVSNLNNANYPPALYAAVSGNPASMQGILWTINLNTLLPATAWASSSTQTLAITPTVNTTVDAKGNPISTAVTSPQLPITPVTGNLGNPIVPANTTLNNGGSLAIDPPAVDTAVGMVGIASPSEGTLNGNTFTDDSSTNDGSSTTTDNFTGSVNTSTGVYTFSFTSTTTPDP
jgi:prepilin-type N-terminal cleavage/methylation domain-containing protein